MVRPGTGSHSPARQSATSPRGWASSPGESCSTGVATTSRRTPRCSAARSENLRAIVWNTSQSERHSHGGGTAWLNECTNGCMSVIDRSYFSYQVAAGRTMSEQIELAVRRAVAPRYVARPLVLVERVGEQRVVLAAEQVAHEVLLALAGGA